MWLRKKRDNDERWLIISCTHCVTHDKISESPHPCPEVHLLPARLYLASACSHKKRTSLTKHNHADWKRYLCKAIRLKGSHIDSLTKCRWLKSSYIESCVDRRRCESAVLLLMKPNCIKEECSSDSVASVIRFFFFVYSLKLSPVDGRKTSAMIDLGAGLK